MMRHSRAALLCLLTAIAGPSPVSAADNTVVESAPIASFQIGSDQTVFGKLTFLSGISMGSTNPYFGSLSAIRFRPDGRHFIGILDTGHWMTGAIERDREGRLAGLAGVDITPMADETGETDLAKWKMDAEGLALRDGLVLVSFEQRHRVAVYPDPGFETAAAGRSLDILIRPNDLRRNGGLELLTVSPPGGPLAGSPVVVSEKSVDRNGNLYGAVLEGPRKGIFGVVQHDRFDITDGAFLRGGDFLLLERRFELSTGIGMRIRRIKAGDIRPGAVVDGEILLDAAFGTQIDNMEGLDVIAGADGSEHVIVVSDDNHSILERNLMLEFRLDE